jgi:nucleotide sugar dehydrogenase
VKVLVVGQGYVGLPLALACVAAGHEVTGVDTDVRRIAALSRGESYLGDVTAADVRTALATGRYHPATEVGAARGFDIAVIAVPTGLSADGLPDLSHVEAAGHAVGAALAVGSTVVLESTTYPGTTTGLLVPILEAESGLRAGSDFLVGYSPERVDPGNPEWPYARIPKVVSGIDEASLDAVEAFYASVVEATVPVASTAIAELSKLLENTFRHVNIALVNELAQFAAGLGVDLGAAIDAASTKPFGFMPFRPGPGRKAMKPKGLVSAQSIASQRSMSSSCEKRSISLTRAMLTCRKVFSRSLAISASFAPRASTTVSMKRL